MSKTINDLNKSLTQNITPSSIGAAASSDLNTVKNNIGTVSNLKTEDKTIVGAINELFQDVDSGKELIATAIDDSNITKNSTFDAMGTAISLLHNQITSLTNELAGKVTPAGTAVAANVLSGKTFINSTGQTITGSMTERGYYTDYSGYLATNDANVFIGIQLGAYMTPTSVGYPEILVPKSKINNLRPENIVSGKEILGVWGSAVVGKKSTASDTVIMGSQYYKNGNKIVNDRINFTILESDNKPLQVLPCFFTGSVRIKTSMWVNYSRSGSTSKLYFKLVRGTTVVKTSSTYTAKYPDNYNESKAISISYDMTGIQPGDVIQMYGFTNYSSADYKGACYPMSICGTIS